MNKREARLLAGKLVKRGILNVETYRGQGPGGQHRNKVQSGIKLRGEWILNGNPIVIRAQACMKSQHDSMREALRVLISRLHARIKEEQGQKERVQTSGFGKGQRVRTYHEPRNTVTDSTGHTALYSDVVGKNNLGEMIDARREARLLEANADLVAKDHFGI